MKKLFCSTDGNETQLMKEILSNNMYFSKTLNEELKEIKDNCDEGVVCEIYEITLKKIKTVKLETKLTEV